LGKKKDREENNDLQASKNECKSSLQLLEEKVSKYEEELEQHRCTKNVLVEKVARKNEEISMIKLELEQKTKQLQKDFLNRNGDGNIELKNNELARKLEFITSNNSELSRENYEFKTQLEKLTEINTELQSKKNKLLKKLESKTINNSELGKENHELKTEVKNLKLQCSKKIILLKELQTSQKILKSELEEEIIAHAEQMVNFDTLKQQNLELKNKHALEIKNLNNQIQQKQNSLDQLIVELEDKKNLAEQLTIDLEMRTKRNQALKNREKEAICYKYEAAKLEEGEELSHKNRTLFDCALESRLV